MENLPKSSLMELRPDALYTVRQLYGLEGAGRMDEAINILQDWINKQPHIIKKDFSRVFLESLLIMCKGLLERAKAKLDKYCTYRTMMPQYFEWHDHKNDSKHMRENFAMAVLPKQTEDYHRVIVWNTSNKPTLTSATTLEFFRYINMVLEYMKLYDYSAGIIIIIDYTNVNLPDFILKLNFMEIIQFFTIFTGAYCLRVKGMHLVSTSKAIETIVSLLKQSMSVKLGGRINVHKSYEALYEIVPRDMLPVDFGGKEKTVSELSDDLYKVITSREHLEYLELMKDACTNEKFRAADKMNNEYMGTPGTFRAMHVD